jgi:hypothetical protein
VKEGRKLVIVCAINGQITSLEYRQIALKQFPLRDMKLFNLDEEPNGTTKG